MLPATYIIGTSIVLSHIPRSSNHNHQRKDKINLPNVHDRNEYPSFVRILRCDRFHQRVPLLWVLHAASSRPSRTYFSWCAPFRRGHHVVLTVKRVGSEHQSLPLVTILSAWPASVPGQSSSWYLMDTIVGHTSGLTAMCRQSTRRAGRTSRTGCIVHLEI